MRGKFITLEGGEGAGKSTQVKRLADFLRGKGFEVVQTREVGGAPSAEAIRELWLTKAEGHWDVLTELLLITAARREHLVKTIFPALQRGAWVISDRFVDSTRAYQGIGLGLGLEAVDCLYNQIAVYGDSQELFQPDLTLLLDLPIETGLARMTARGGQDDRYQQKDKLFHQKLRDAYLLLAEQYAHRFRVVNAAENADDVAAKIMLTVGEHFGL